MPCLILTGYHAIIRAERVTTGIDVLVEGTQATTSSFASSSPAGDRMACSISEPYRHHEWLESPPAVMLFRSYSHFVGQDGVSLSISQAHLAIGLSEQEPSSMRVHFGDRCAVRTYSR